MNEPAEAITTEERKTSDSQAMQDYYDGKANHPGGRPTKYNPTIIRKTKEYLNNYEEQGDRLPQIPGLAKWLKISRDTIYEWINQEEKKEFSDIVCRLLTEQERLLVNNGLASGFNSNITKLMLVKHGYHDKTEVTGKIQVSKIERNIIDVTPQDDAIEHQPETPKSLIE